MGDHSRRFDAGEALVPGLGLLFALVFFLQMTDAPEQAWLWPAIAALLCLVFWVPIVITFVWRRSEEPPEKLRISWLWREGSKAGQMLAATIGYLIAITWLGFTLCNFLFMLVLFRGLGGKRWRVNLAVAAGIALFLHLALVVFMQLNLPRLSLGGLEI